jgi:hypothetical protein
MNLALMLLTPLFPFDPTLDTALGHRHLVIAYLVVLAIQGVYFTSLLRRRSRAKRDSRE